MKTEFNLKPTDLTTHITANVSSDKVTEIVESATGDASLAGPQLWHSLVYSGISLGVEETQQHFAKQTGEIVLLLRDMLTKIDAAKATTDDIAALKSFTAFAEDIQARLRSRAGVLVALFSKKMSEYYGIDPALITADVEPEDLPRSTLVFTGLLAYRKAPEYFIAWSLGTRTGTINKLKCKCPTCINRCLVDDTYEVDELAAAIEYFGGLDETFVKFSIFFLTGMRETLCREMAGIEDNHGESHTAEDITRGIMEHLRSPSNSTLKGRPPEESA